MDVNIQEVLALLGEKELVIVKLSRENAMLVAKYNELLAKTEEKKEPEKVDDKG